VEYVENLLLEHREKDDRYKRVGVISLNAMRNLPNFFNKGQLRVMFFLYADPHFKKSKHKLRIIQRDLLDVYAFCLRVDGRLYIATDVEDLFNWEVEHLDAHPLFERIPEQEALQDPLVPLMRGPTLDAQKAKAEGRGQWWAAYRRIMHPVEQQ